MKSIIQKEKMCFLTKCTECLDKHHIFFGNPDRKNSERYGLWVWLRHDMHIADSPHKTPHNDREVDLMLKRIGQRAFEKVHGSRELFVRIFGRNYL